MSKRLNTLTNSRAIVGGIICLIRNAAAMRMANPVFKGCTGFIPNVSLTWAKYVVFQLSASFGHKYIIMPTQAQLVNHIPNLFYHNETCTLARTGRQMFTIIETKQERHNLIRSGM